MRVAFFGTSAFAVPTLEAIRARDSGHALVAVVTQPARPRGRGLRAEPSPVERCAEGGRAPILAFESVKAPETGAALRALEAEVFVVVAYGSILPAEVLALPPRGAWNVHASLLPRHRGASPIAWTLLEGDPRAGVTFFRITEGVDTGPILLQRSVPVGARETAAELSKRLARLGAEAALEGLARIERGEVDLEPQDPTQATRTRRFTKEDGRIDWSRPAEALDRRVRALNPWPGTFTTVAGRVLKVLEAAPQPESGAPGTVLEAGHRLLVAAGRGSLALLRVHPASGRPIGGADYARGRRLERGARMGS